jgi:hypothetical protein
MRELLPDIPAVAVFDTSFHSTLPAKVSAYPIPEEYRLAGKITPATESVPDPLLGYSKSCSVAHTFKLFPNFFKAFGNMAFTEPVSNMSVARLYPF